MTIIKGSPEVVHLKKLPLKVWLLRDEIEQILQVRYKKTNDIEKIKDISDLQEEYQEKTEPQISKEPISIPQRGITLPKGKIWQGQFFLFEIDMEKIYFFSQHDFLIGNAITIELKGPNVITLHGVILYSQRYDFNNRVISELKYPFRVICQFNFLKVGEKTLLRNFLTSLHVKEEEKIKSVPKEEEEKKSA